MLFRDERDFGPTCNKKNKSMEGQSEGRVHGEGGIYSIAWQMCTCVRRGVYIYIFNIYIVTEYNSLAFELGGWIQT